MVLSKELQHTEYNEYYKQYIDQVPEHLSLIEALKTGKEYSSRFFLKLTNDQLLSRYEVNKWTPKEVLLHLIDTERIFSYRALRFLRQDETSLPGFDQDDYVLSSNANTRSITSLVNEYESVRDASIALYDSINADQNFIGRASDSPLSSRAAGFIIAGHERHHIRIIKERYL